MYRYLLFTASLLLIIFSSCVKDEEFSQTTITPVDPQEIVTTSIYGKVISEMGESIENAEVFMQTFNGLETVTTDEKGYFLFENVGIKGASAFITVKSEGNFNAFRRMDVVKNTYNYTEIQPRERRIEGTINMSTGGTVFAGGAIIHLPANSVESADGTPYTGTVDVAMAYIEPTSENLIQQIVGDLSGISEENEVVSLTTYGMMYVELLDQMGNELQLSEGSEATLEFSVPSEIASVAPEIIPLWYFDEELGRWIEDGSATFNGSTYEGQVTHFSVWNLDWKGETIEVSGCVQANQRGLANLQVKVTIPGTNITMAGGYLSSDGKFTFINFPANEEFTLTICDQCGETIWEMTYPPSSTNVDLGVISVDVPSEDLAVVEGVAIDCNNDPIEGARVELEYDNQQIIVATESDGSFSISTVLCAPDIPATLRIYDLDNLNESDTLNLILSSTEVDLGNIPVCDQISEFCSFDTVGVNVYFETNAEVSENVTGAGYVLNSYTGVQNGSVKVIFEELSQSNTIVGSATIQVIDNNNFAIFILDTQQPVNINMTEVDLSVGGKVSGTISGTFIGEGTGVTFNTTGEISFTAIVVD